MNIEDFEIKIKKYDREKNVVIANITVCKELEVRGFVVRYTETKYSTRAIWVVSPPVIFTGRGKYKKPFWIIYLKNSELWAELQKEIIDLTITYTNLSG